MVRVVVRMSGQANQRQRVRVRVRVSRAGPDKKSSEKHYNVKAPLYLYTVLFNIGYKNNVAIQYCQCS